MTMLGAPTGRVLEFTIGDRLRKARQSLGDHMDVRAFAALIGVSRNTVTNYELEVTSEDRMKPIVLRQWALATGVDYTWLVTGSENDGPDGDGVHPPGLEPGTHWLRDNVTQLRPPTRQDGPGPRRRVA